MKAETPVLTRGGCVGDYYAPDGRIWLCGEWVEHYFGTPLQLSLEISDAPSKEAVPIDLWIDDDGETRWAPATRTQDTAPNYQDGQMFPALSGWLRAWPIREKRRRYYVTVWIYE